MTKLEPITKGKTSMEVAAMQAEIDIAYKLAESIRKYPAKWEADEYCFTGPGPIVLWIANGSDSFKQYHSEHRAKKQPVILGKEVCQKIIWPAYIEWSLQINSGYLNPEPSLNWLRNWLKPRKKPIALLEYKPEKQLN